METIKPKNEQEWLQLRTRDITSSEVAALFGISPWVTEFELWHRKHDGHVVELQENVRMVWGTRLQDSIARGIAQDQGWDVRRMDEYIRDPELRMGSSFDFAVGDDGLLEVKNVDSLQFRRGWTIEEGGLEAPPHIEIQVQHQLAVSGRKHSHIGALVGGNTVQLIERKPDAEIIAAIRNKVRAFWASVDAGTPPSPNFQMDASFVSKLYGFADPGKVFDAKGNVQLSALMERYQLEAEVEKQAKGRKAAIRAEVLTIVKDAEKVLGDGYTISAGVIGPTDIAAYTRQGYRNFKPSFTKKKEEAK